MFIHSLIQCSFTGSFILGYFFSSRSRLKLNFSSCNNSASLLLNGAKKLSKNVLVSFAIFVEYREPRLSWSFHTLNLTSSNISDQNWAVGGSENIFSLLNCICYFCIYISNNNTNLNNISCIFIAMGTTNRTTSIITTTNNYTSTITS